MAIQILLPPNSKEACLQFKRPILLRLIIAVAEEVEVSSCGKSPQYIVVDEFEDAATKFS